MVKILHLRLYTLNQGKQYPVEDPDKPLLFAEEDTLIFDLGGYDQYRFERNGDGLVYSADCSPLFVDMISGAIQLKKIILTGASGSIVEWVVIPHIHINGMGLCPCSINSLKSFSPGDQIQLWSGEIFCYHSGIGMRLLQQAWTPGLDSTYPEAGRFWEK